MFIKATEKRLENRELNSRFIIVILLTSSFVVSSGPHTIQVSSVLCIHQQEVIVHVVFRAKQIA